MCGIYLDYQSACPVDPRVQEFAERFLGRDFGNPSALHSRGLAAKAALEEARTHVAELINAEGQQSVILTAGVTEANNLAIGLKHEEAHGSMAIILGRENNPEQMPIIVNAAKKTVERLRSISPL